MRNDLNAFACHSKFSYFCVLFMEDVAQLVRASDCGSEGRGFEALHSPITFLHGKNFFHA